MSPTENAIRSIPLPVGVKIPTGQSAASFVRHLLAEGLKLSSDIGSIAAPDTSGSTKVFFHPPLAAKITALAESRGWTFGETACRLIVLGAGREKARRDAVASIEADYLACLDSLPFGARDAYQARYYREVMAGLSHRAIVLAEASTGCGKSRVLAAAAISRVLDGVFPVVIAAPAIANVGHLWNEFVEVRDQYRYPEGRGPESVSAAVLLGAGEFVDDLQLTSYLDRYESSDPDGAEARAVARIREWVSLGAPHGWRGAGIPDADETALYRAMLLHGVTLSWLMSDLRQIADLAGQFPAPTFQLRDDVDSGEGVARQLVAAMRDVAQNASIIFCTHAMIGAATRHAGKVMKAHWETVREKRAKKEAEKEAEKEKSAGSPPPLEADGDADLLDEPPPVTWNPLPTPRILLIDEAHGFEKAIADSRGRELSFFRLRIDLNAYKRQFKLGKGATASQAIPVVREIMRLLSDECVRRGLSAGDSLLLKDDPENGLSAAAVGRLREKLSELRAMFGRKTALAGINNATAHAAMISQAISAIDGTFVGLARLQFSPTKRYPSIILGPQTVARTLRGIWDTAKDGVVLASGTLYQMTATGNLDCRYVSSLLNLDLARLSPRERVRADYLQAIPRLILPAPATVADPASLPAAVRAGIKAISRPASVKKAKGGNHDELTQAWLHNVAAVMSDQIVGTTRGGTLALCSSYMHVAWLAEALASRGVPAERLVAASMDRPFSQTVDDYRARHADGRKPVLLACGQAWTGINLNDDRVSAAEDTLLTDLVVVSLPIGLNRSTTMLWRKERVGLSVVMDETMLLLVQGFGRLVRRDGVSGRRLWFLDGRVWDPSWLSMRDLVLAVKYYFSKEAAKPDNVALIDFGNVRFDTSPAG